MNMNWSIRQKHPQRGKKKQTVNDQLNVTDCAQAGAPLISMSHTLKLSSTMKSNPKSWKLW